MIVDPVSCLRAVEIRGEDEAGWILNRPGPTTFHRSCFAIHSTEESNVVTHTSQLVRPTTESDGPGSK